MIVTRIVCISISINGSRILSYVLSEKFYFKEDLSPPLKTLLFHRSTMGKTRKSEKASTSIITVENVAKGSRKLGAFTVLQIGSHYSYMKAHEGEDDRTMFLVNLPPDTTDLHLKQVFAQAGGISTVKLWKPNAELESLHDDSAEATKSTAKGKGTQPKVEGPPAIVSLPPLDPRYPHNLLPTATSAHITFLDETGLQKALELSTVKAWPDLSSASASSFTKASTTEVEGQSQRKPNDGGRREVESSASSVPIGLDYLFARHRSLRPSLDKVKIHVDSVIANYDYRRAHPVKKRSGIQVASIGPNGELLDEDGFIIVQSTGKYGRTSEGQIGASIKVARSRPSDELEDEAAREKKKKRFELDDFYRFQRREQKREELASLRAKFREDQEKVQKLKSSRSFKPF